MRNNNQQDKRKQNLLFHFLQLYPLSAIFHHLPGKRKNFKIVHSPLMEQNFLMPCLQQFSINAPGKPLMLLEIIDWTHSLHQYQPTQFLRIEIRGQQVVLSLMTGKWNSPNFRDLLDATPSVLFRIAHFRGLAQALIIVTGIKIPFHADGTPGARRPAVKAGHTQGNIGSGTVKKRNPEFPISRAAINEVHFCHGLSEYTASGAKIDA
jgi:hypothetical protein